ncbi:hypothetical protein NGM99_17100 [Mesorhizobium sp. RP14(2022)]|uniref:Uncharacterized protein n=1 Tax=Mesorhizobium liriopis TaxID=2953882 RepID=A0ABT1C9J3_9HYPH|nr:hypothetical protein [Mesorhizobium liriopis]MCO6051504.1 hypothetical protein [Mesorhizobium liriopis]
MPAHIAREAGDVVDDDDALTLLVFFEEGEHRLHARPVGVTARYVVTKDVDDVEVAIARELAAAGLLAVKAVAVPNLLIVRHAAIDDGFRVGFILLAAFHALFLVAISRLFRRARVYRDGRGFRQLIDSVKNLPTDIDGNADLDHRAHNVPKRLKKLDFLLLVDLEFVEIAKIRCCVEFEALPRLTGGDLVALRQLETGAQMFVAHAVRSFPAGDDGKHQLYRT